MAIMGAMMSDVKRGHRWAVWVLFGLWLLWAPAARAGVDEAKDSVFDHRTQVLLEAVQKSAEEGGIDLPLALRTRRDIYLFITEGAAYTEVRALALPTVPPQQLAQALAGATAGTRLAGGPVMWSADDYSAALVEEGHGRLLMHRTLNTVPVGEIVARLRRAGFVPHALLRIPLHAMGAPLPVPRHQARAFNWYGQRQVAGMGVVTVRAALSWADIGLVLFFCSSSARRA